jgi:hypothetical protein
MIEQDGEGTLGLLRSLQRGHCEALKLLAGPIPVAFVPLSAKEVRGVPVLRELGEQVCRQLGIGQ